MNDSLITFCGHHKGGTVWISKIVASVCRALVMQGEYINSPKRFNFDLEAFVRNNEFDFICYANADIAYVKRLKNVKGFHVIRDPRDIIVSGYFSHRNSHPTSNWPELSLHREALGRLPKEEGLLREMVFSKTLRTDGVDLNLFGSMQQWDYAMPNMLELKFEDIIEQPRERLRDVFEFLGLLVQNEEEAYSQSKISPKKFAEIIDRNDFTRQAGGRKRGEEDEKSHYRKGISGDWRNHFSPRHKEFFNHLYGDLLIQLGYEADTNW